jgi:hypothetical protein
MKPPKNHHSPLKSGNTPLVFGVLDTLRKQRNTENNQTKKTKKHKIISEKRLKISKND